MTALRFNEGKPLLSYLTMSFSRAVHAIARIMEFGANKYEDGNWRLGNKPDREYWDSFFRHLDYYTNGEYYDQDSGCCHIGHMIWNLCALLELNHGEKPVIDAKVFKERMEYWAEEKRKREAMIKKEDLDHVDGRRLH